MYTATNAEKSSMTPPLTDFLRIKEFFGKTGNQQLSNGRRVSCLFTKWRQIVKV